MGSGIALAWLTLGWLVVSIVWHVVEEPSKTTYSSPFYKVVLFVVGIASLLLAVWTITTP